jgi:putative hydrolase of the HAD superfamily
MVCRAVIFDYIGTLVNCGSYSMAASREKLYNALVNEGFEVGKEKFLAAYIVAHEKYRKIRYQQFREVTNAVWVAEALCSLGFEVTAEDLRVKAALNVFFQDFIDTLELRDGAKKLLEQARRRCKVGLISNFTHAPVIYKSLRKLKVNEFFSVVGVSEENGWRKPSIHIFQDALNRLQVDADEAVYVGDSPLEDIKGAKQVGLRTVFVPSQFNTVKDLMDSQQQPDYLANDLPTLCQNLNQILSFRRV